MKDSPATPKKLSDLLPNERNPRRISFERLNLLQESLDKFGDLSGIVFNRRTGVLVGGHQREKVLPPDSKIEIVKEYAKPTKVGTVREGHVLIDGDRFTFREVDWSERKQNMAMIAANRHSGEWDNEMLGKVLSEIGSDERQLAGFTDDEYQKLISEGTDAVRNVQFTARKDREGYVLFELIMLHENKTRLVTVLDKVRSQKSMKTLEEALMHVCDQYENQEKKAD